MKKLLLLITTITLLSACSEPSIIDSNCDCELYVTVKDISTDEVIIPEFLYSEYQDEHCTTNGLLININNLNQETKNIRYPDIYDKEANITFRYICD
ncbi:hypothetical protein ACFSKN_04655 [Mariniflexile gromovii]|uniref:Lipoprotein n=1 Tax=Mariniflexile gromovii TaxID=362523 RepID=A0ABS4BW95_9FLAO|nr:hypothetical protein [Mariniflexile gromovii]MBP0904862.1 hypothetical protein [Mariniflexile gromovii]